MKKSNLAVLAFVVLVTTCSAYAQGTSAGFFGGLSQRIYCAITRNCYQDVTTNNGNTEVHVTVATTTTSTPTYTPKPSTVVYVKGKDGKNGTTTIIYQTIYGAPGASPAAYVYAGGNTNSNPYQTTVPGDIFSTFVHHFQFEDAKGNDLMSINVTASNTNTVNLLATDASITNATTTSLFASVAQIMQLFAKELTFVTATGTDIQVVHASTTDLAATGTVALSGDTYIASTTITNAEVQAGNATLTTAVVGNATATNFYTDYSSTSEATSTHLFSVFAYFMNLGVDTLTFLNATGTNIQVENASTTNLAATGTVALSGDTFIASTTISKAEIQGGNATLTSSVVGNSTTTNFFGTLAKIIDLGANTITFLTATGTNLQAANASTTNLTATGTTQLSGNTYISSTTIASAQIQSGNATTTNLFSTKASITNATTTAFFANLLNAISATFTNLVATNGTVTNATSTNLFATNVRLANATVTNLKVTNCAEGNILCDGGNYTKPFVVGQDRPLVLGTLNDGNIEFVTGNDIYTNPVATSAKLIVENGNYSAGDVQVVNTLKIGKNIVASGTATVTNLYATGTFALATGTIASTSASWLNILKGLFVSNATITNATSTNLFATRIAGTSATITNATITNATITNATTSSIVSGFASTTNLLAYVTNATFGYFNFIFANTGIISNFQSGTINTTNLNATGTISVNLLNASNTIATNATFTNATVSALAIGSFRPAFGNATVTANASLVPGADSMYDLGSATNKWRDLWVSSSTIHIGNTALSIGNTGNLQLNGVDILTASSSIGTTTVVSTTSVAADFLNATMTNGTSTNFFATIFSAATGMISNLFATNATITNATSTNFASTGTFSLATGTIASTTIANAKVTNLTATNVNLSLATVTNAIVSGLTMSTQIGRATSSTFGASGVIGSVDFNTVFNMTASAPNLVFTLATPTNTTAGRIVYVNNVGTNDFTMYGSTISQDSGRTFVWTGSGWSIHADGVGSSATTSNQMTIIHQVLGSAFNMTGNTPSTVADLSWNVAARETWYYVITGVVSGGDNSNNGMKVQVTAPSGSSACSSTLTNFDLDNHWTTAVCNGTISGTSNWTSPNNFRVEGVFTTGGTGGSARFNASKNTAAGGTLTLAASSTVLTAYKISGADLAEVYYSESGPIGIGEIVSLDGTGQSQVSRSSVANDSNALGIVSTRPGQVIGENDGVGTPVVVGLSGRVPVRVTANNGEIKPGDYITTSEIPGVGMKATADGRVVGKALTGFNGAKDEVGMVYVFVQNTYYEGDAQNGIYSKIQNGFKSSIEKLSDVYLEMVLKVNKLSAREVKTEQLCIGDTCISEQDLKDFKAYKAQIEELKNSKVDKEVPAPVAPVAPEVPAEEVPSTQTVATDTQATTSTSTSVTQLETVATDTVMQ